MNSTNRLDTSDQATFLKHLKPKVLSGKFTANGTNSFQRTWKLGNTDGSEIPHTHQLRLIVYPPLFTGFCTCWCRISSNCLKVTLSHEERILRDVEKRKQGWTNCLEFEEKLCINFAGSDMLRSLQRSI